LMHLLEDRIAQVLGNKGLATCRESLKGCLHFENVRSL
jgi:hypothetical protein